MNKTAEVLIKLRKKKGVTQNELASKLGVSSQAVSKWERGENLPDSMLLLDIAKFYGVTVEELLRGCIQEQTDEQEFMSDFTIMISIFVFVLATVSFFTLRSTHLQAAILTAVILGSIAALLLLYVGLRSEYKK